MWGIKRREQKQAGGALRSGCRADTSEERELFGQEEPPAAAQFQGSLARLMGSHGAAVAR